MGKKPKPGEKDYKDPVVDENGVITYNIQPHDSSLDVKFEIQIGPADSTSEQGGT